MRIHPIHSRIPGIGRAVAMLIPLLLLLVLVVNSCQSIDERTGETDTLLIKNVHLVDAVHGLREAQDLLVIGDQIESVGPSGSLEIPEGGSTLEGEGRYLIPGLWESHFHVTNTPAMRDSFYPLFLINGITYARDTAMTMEEIEPVREWTRQVHEEHGWAPDLYLIGPHVDGERLSWASSVSAATSDEARAHIDRLDALDVDEMKVYELIQPDVFHTVLEEATSRGYRVTSHIPLTMDVIEAVDAGLTAMEHLQNLEFACAENWEALREERRTLISEQTEMKGNELREFLHAHQRGRALDRQDDARCRKVIDHLAEQQVWQVPTMVISTLEEHRLFETERWRDTFNYLPEEVREKWLETAEAMTDAPSSDVGLRYAEWIREKVLQMETAGVPMMAGTDMPLALLTPGFSLQKELELLASTGIEPLRVLEMATLAPAEYYGLEQEQGSLAPGMAADLVLLRANPVEDIRATQQIDAVVRDGRLFDVDALEEVKTWLRNQ